MVVAVAKAVEAGAHSAVCASTGNTSASAAAYCAAAGVRCNVVVPEGKVALGKLAQAVAHGARILVLRGNFDAALSRVREIAPGWQTDDVVAAAYEPKSGCADPVATTHGLPIQPHSLDANHRSTGGTHGTCHAGRHRPLEQY